MDEEGQLTSSGQESEQESGQESESEVEDGSQREEEQTPRITKTIWIKKNPTPRPPPRPKLPERDRRAETEFEIDDVRREDHFWVHSTPYYIRLGRKPAELHAAIDQHWMLQRQLHFSNSRRQYGHGNGFENAKGRRCHAPTPSRYWRR